MYGAPTDNTSDSRSGADQSRMIPDSVRKYETKLSGSTFVGPDTPWWERVALHKTTDMQYKGSKLSDINGHKTAMQNNSLEIKK